MRIHRSALWLALGTIVLVCAPAAAYEFKDCDSTARSNLRPAANYIRDNMSSIVDQFTFLTDKQRQEIVRKWPNMKIDCTDNSSACRRHGWAGHAHGGPGNQVNICHANMVEDGDTTCGAVGTIMHEMGHANGFRMVPGHNDEPVSDFVRNNDPMYRMGAMAASHCRAAAIAGTIVDALFAGTPRTALGGACNNNDDCQSGNCGAGTCTCNNDSDCPSGQTCFRPVTGPNFCSSTNRAVGASCTRNDQCASGKCEGDNCVCDQDGDCPSGQTCFRPVTGPNFCSSTNRALGASCTRNDQCASGQCEDGDCVCARDSDCPGNQRCRDSMLTKNFCEPR